jgi:GT2 family glycosyltransferase
MSALNTDYPNYEILLVDNNSTDDSLKIAEAEFSGDPHLKIIKSEKNLGFSGGNNLGYKYAKGDYIVFLNNDTIVDAHWIRALVKAMDADLKIGLAQSLIFTMDGQKVLNAGWVLNNYLAKKTELFTQKPCDLAFEPVFEISFACGAAMMIRRSLVDEIGLFEDAMPFFYDDTLLGLKTWISGRRVVTVPASKIRHLIGGTRVWTTRFTTYHLQTANICLLFDSYPMLIGLVSALLVSVINTATNWLFCLQNKNVEALRGSLEAYFWALKNFRFVWRNTRNHWDKAKVSPKRLASDFMRIQLPPALYLFPSKLSIAYHLAEVDKYEKAILRRK